MGKSQGNPTSCTSLTDSAHLRNRLFADHADHLPVRSFHNNTPNFKVNVSVTFLVYGEERPLLMAFFLEHFGTSLFLFFTGNGLPAV